MPKKKGRPRTNPEKVQQVFDLYVSNKWTYAEIADKADVSIGSIHSIVKLDPRYPAWRAAEDAKKASGEQA